MEENKSDMWKLWENHNQYKKNQGYIEQWPININFFEGRQWPDATASTKNLPRPVMNIIQFICENKKANILSSSLKCIFKPVSYKRKINNFEIEKDENAIEAADLFTKFTDYIFKEIDIEELDNQAMSDGVQLGTYIYHFFWNKDKYGNTKKYIGGLDCEIIDPLNIAVSNPEEKDEQKQEWIIISSREKVDSCVELAKKNEIESDKIELIVGDNDENEYGLKRVESGEYCTVLTKYFRKNGEVFFEKATKATIIQKATSLSPDINKVILNNNTDSETVKPDIAETDELDESKTYKMNLYPVVIGSYRNKKKSIYGISEIEPLITTQKSINFTYALCLLAVQNIGFPKMIVKPGALQNQNITNAPGEMLIDYSRTGNGIGYMNPPQFTGFPLTIIDGIISNTRSFSGSTEVVTGEIIGKTQMSGSAIATLQTQAKVPIEVIQKQFWRARKKSARICEQFFKAYYKDDREFSYVNEKGKPITESFNGTKYANIEFETVVDVGSASVYSEALSISLLDSLKANGDIDLDMYIELYPDNAMTFKTRLKQLLQKVKLPQEIEQAIVNDKEIYDTVVNYVNQTLVLKNEHN